MVLGEMNKEVMKNVIKLLTIVILMGTMVIWIMMPTSTYKKIWLKSMRTKLGKSIYFGKPGKFINRHTSSISISFYKDHLYIRTCFSFIRSKPFGLHVPNDSIGFSWIYLPSLEETNDS